MHISRLRHCRLTSTTAVAAAYRLLLRPLNSAQPPPDVESDRKVRFPRLELCKEESTSTASLCALHVEADRPPIPLDELRGVQRLFYHYAQQHHPDTRGTALSSSNPPYGTDAAMVEGNTAYQLLKSCTPEERRAALCECFPGLTFPTSTNSATTANNVKVVHIYKQHIPKEWKPYRNPLKTPEDEAFDVPTTIDGPSYSVSRPWRTPDGRRMQGLPWRILMSSRSCEYGETGVTRTSRYSLRHLQHQEGAANHLPSWDGSSTSLLPFHIAAAGWEA